MKRSATLNFVLLLLGLSLLCGCGYKAGAMVNGKADLPIPNTIILRNNETGAIKEFDSADEEFERLYDALNTRWGMYGDKKELGYYLMAYAYSPEEIPCCEAEFRFDPGSVADHNIIPSNMTSDDVIGVILSLDKGSNKAAYIISDMDDFRAATALVYEPSDDTLEYALSLLNQ